MALSPLQCAANARRAIEGNQKRIEMVLMAVSPEKKLATAARIELFTPGAVAVERRLIV